MPRLYTEIWGERQKDTVVLLHGSFAADPAAPWAKQRDLAERYRLVLPVSATSVVRSRCPSLHVMPPPVDAHDPGLWRVLPKSVPVGEQAYTPHKGPGSCMSQPCTSPLLSG